MTAQLISLQSKINLPARLEALETELSVLRSIPRSSRDLKRVRNLINQIKTIRKQLSHDLPSSLSHLSIVSEMKDLKTSIDELITTVSQLPCQNMNAAPVLQEPSVTSITESISKTDKNVEFNELDPLSTLLASNLFEFQQEQSKETVANLLPEHQAALKDLETVANQIYTTSLKEDRPSVVPVLQKLRAEFNTKIKQCAALTVSMESSAVPIEEAILPGEIADLETRLKSLQKEKIMYGHRFDYLVSSKDKSPVGAFAKKTALARKTALVHSIRIIIKRLFLLHQ